MENGGLRDGEGLSKSYVRSILLIVDAVLKNAVENRWCQPTAFPVFKPIPNKKEIRVLTCSESRRLEYALLNEDSLTSLGILITLKTGLRIGEVCALTWDDIDLENDALFVRSTVTRIRANTSSSKTTLKFYAKKPYGDRITNYNMLFFITLIHP